MAARGDIFFQEIEEGFYLAARAVGICAASALAWVF